MSWKLFSSYCMSVIFATAALAGPADSLAADSAAAPSTVSSSAFLHDANPKPKWHAMVTNLPDDWVRWYKTAFTSETIPQWVIVTALTTAMYFTDEESYRLSRKIHESSPAIEWWGNFFKELGDGRSQFGLAGALAVYGLAAGDNRALRTGSQIAEVVLASGAVVQVIKHVTGRASPDGYPERAFLWNVFPNQIEYLQHVSYYDAFPSGHITTSMATVIVMAENYPELKWIKPVGYTLVTLVGVGMANTGIHWYSDYPLGIALGYAFGMIVAHPEGIVLGNENEKNRALQLSPAVVGPGLGLSLSLKLR